MGTSCCDIVDSGVFMILKKGAKSLLAPTAHKKEGGQTKFSNFLLCQKQIFLANGAWPIWPRGKYATDCRLYRLHHFYFPRRVT